MSIFDSSAPPRSFHDADETLQAIHRGEVDALVVLKELMGPQVVMLQGAEEPYRVLVERMTDGALTVDSAGVILYANNRLSELTGYSAAELVGRDFATLFASDAPTLAPEVSIELGLLRRDNISVPVSVWSSSVSIGGETATLVSLTDLSNRRRAEQIAADERFARSILEQATEAIVVLAQDGRITRASGRAEQLAGRSPIGLTFSEAFPLETQGEAQSGRLARFSAAALDTLLANKPFHGVEVGLQGEELTNRVFLLSAGPLLDERRASVGSIVTLTEITERKRAEERQAMLVAELNHRVKNILSVVQAMAYKTIRSSDSLAGFNDAFLGRLRALALAHDILTQTHWAGTNLDDLIAAILKPHRPVDDDRIAIDGRAVRLSARATVPLSMILHELTTNAIKYGALSTPTGRIDITWKLDDRDDQSVELIWKERGGPKVERRAASGFGTALIDRVVGADLGGSSHIDFDPAGICCTVRFRLPGESRIDTLNLGID